MDIEFAIGFVCVKKSPYVWVLEIECRIFPPRDPKMVQVSGGNPVDAASGRA